MLQNQHLRVLLAVITIIVSNHGKIKHLAIKIKSTLFGVAVGDASVVPFEFNSRQTICNNPVTDMIG